MPAVQLADGELNYLLEGPAGKPVLVLSNSLGTDLHMWDNQIAAFTGHFQVLRYDTRGHGKSVVSEGTYSIEQNGRDVLVLLDALSIDKAFFCGLSMGGLIGQWLAINASERLQRVVLCNTAAKIGNPDIWNPRIDTVLRDGQAAMVALRDASVARWFTPAFALAEPDRVDTVVGMLARTSPQGYAANCAAVRDADFREQIASITLPVLVVCGTEDAVTTPADGRFMIERIQGAQMIELHAAHLSSVEAGEAFSAAVLAFLTAE
ncbi:3-oxoadipate enol-lactonase [Pseudomonas syringae pv. actinidiae]|uniref:Pimeloyl-ACP methyl ester carboxylesterase n=5 Tax=Pseudomonas syringae TaxID=317 RepID=A0A2V0QCZ7_PSESF|nr:3-oxoadipate enol-lactonase [Pseudomonas syringae]AKT31222.1 3-oxoadipate enol-lactonase [Pseudomonas syringae pv. actinidiae ICMP 18884]AOE57614.1 3-oxoadipate enol-lactonase [Pseudomonas syringae pv. actinidiae ICMP 18708]APP98569.1 3-oxoadipate enol-lactonase [Pseudomonas syringae pv. actinidiae]APQ04327.1 3-oxoadipate enol-lactonase [Pseudomonas syringae pv. actinidiae]AQL37872.1 3-oxoadipate enol-lactonase [Pseudomonas syringae pv. actinidiae ICMP 9853]